MKRLWFPDGYTEAHRTLPRITDLCQALDHEGGIEWCIGHDFPEGRVDGIFCGSIFKADHVRKNNPNRVPVIHYNWDLYPSVVKTRWDQGWGKYVDDLKAAALIIVPGAGTAIRTHQMAGKKPVIIRSPVKLWDVPPRPDDVLKAQTYALDVMRDYPWDKGHEYPDIACKRLGIPLVRTKTAEPWDRFRWLVANAACLISAVEEASTGGLTLLEGYAHGVPVIVNDSGWNEAGRYFGDRAKYFDNTIGANDLAIQIDDVMSQPAPSAVETTEQRAWVKRKFSDAVFAAKITGEILKCLN